MAQAFMRRQWGCKRSENQSEDERPKARPLEFEGKKFKSQQWQDFFLNKRPHYPVALHTCHVSDIEASPFEGVGEANMFPAFLFVCSRVNCTIDGRESQFMASRDPGLDKDSL